MIRPAPDADAVDAQRLPGGEPEGDLAGSIQIECLHRLAIGKLPAVLHRRHDTRADRSLGKPQPDADLLPRLDMDAREFPELIGHQRLRLASADLRPCLRGPSRRHGGQGRRHIHQRICRTRRCSGETAVFPAGWSCPGFGCSVGWMRLVKARTGHSGGCLRGWIAGLGGSGLRRVAMAVGRKVDHRAESDEEDDRDEQADWVFHGSGWWMRKGLGKVNE